MDDSHNKIDLITSKTNLFFARLKTESKHFERSPFDDLRPRIREYDRERTMIQIQGLTEAQSKETW